MSRKEGGSGLANFQYRNGELIQRLEDYMKKALKKTDLIFPFISTSLLLSAFTIAMYLCVFITLGVLIFLYLAFQ